MSHIALSMIESEKIIKLPNKFRDPYYFEEIISAGDTLSTQIDTLDMSRLTFIEPYSMVSLLLLGRNYLRSTGEKIKLINIPLNINQYLTRMDFFNYHFFEVPEYLNEKLMLKRSAFSKRVIEITEIPNKERESVRVISDVISVFRKRASHILKFWIADHITDYFVTVISELCQNIFEHSLGSGYIAMQTYTVGQENIVRLVISDSGIGILKSFENKTEIQYKTPAELLEMNLTTPISSKREFGYGLCQVNTIIEKLKGTIFIRSDNSSVSFVYHKKKHNLSSFLKNDLTFFPGTQITISLSS